MRLVRDDLGGGDATALARSLRAWMVGLTAVIYLEKVVPTGGLVSRIAGLALCAVGLRRLLA